eukprot:1157712-Pelagomonas_calceolata.AAC.11
MRPHSLNSEDITFSGVSESYKASTDPWRANHIELKMRVCIPRALSLTYSIAFLHTCAQAQRILGPAHFSMRAR